MAQRNEGSKICFEKIEMPIWQKDFFSIPFSNSESCYIHYDQHANCVLLVGHCDAVRENHYFMLKELHKVKVKLLTLTPSMFCILSKDQGKEYLQNLNSVQNELGEAKAILQEDSLLVASKDENVLNGATKYLQTRINYKDTIESDVQIPIDKLHFIQSTLENKFLVKVSWTGNDLLIFSVEGIKEDVIESSKYIKTFVKENRVHEKSFIATGSHAMFLYKKLEGQIRHYLQDFVAADFVSTEVQIAMTFQGDKITVNQIHSQLTDLKKKVTPKFWNLRSEFKEPEDLTLITKDFNSEKMETNIDSFEAANSCLRIKPFTVSASNTRSTSEIAVLSLNDRVDVSENQSYGNEHLHGPLSLDLPISNSDASNHHSTNIEPLKSTRQDLSSHLMLQHTTHENETNVHVSQSLPEKNDSFKKVQLENNEKYDKELAAKEAKIKQLLEELAKKNEQPKHCTETINMTTWQQEFMPHSFGNFEGCLVKFDQHAKIAILEGEYESVKEHQLKLLKELKKLKEGLLALTPAMCTILSKDQGKQYLHKLNSSHLNGAKVFLQDASLFVAAKDEESLNSAMEFLKTRINYKETLASGVKLPIEKLISMQSKLENSFLVKVSWNDNDLVICVEGIKDDVFQSSIYIRTLMEKYRVHEKSFLVTGSHARFLSKNLENEISKCLLNVEIVDFRSTKAELSITFKGDRKMVNLVQRKLKELETKVTSKCWDLRSEFKKTEDLMLITKGFSSEKMKKKVDAFETKHKCIVIPKLPSSETFSFRASKKTKAARSVHVSSSKSRINLTTAVPTQEETKLQFILNDTCQLVIKPNGDIIREPSDILVCVLDQNADLRNTRVGQTFNKVCRNLRKYLEVEHTANPGAAVLTTQGQLNPLKCLAICHIIFTPWNPHSSPAHLSNAIQLVFGQAVALGAKSVSFPVLGCGRAFGFPASDVAQITLSSIKSSNLGNTIQKVVLLAPDEGLFNEFKNEARKHFKSVPITVSGAVGGAASEKTITDETADDHEDDESDKSEDDEPFVEILTPDLQGSSIGEISIVALHSNGLENLWSNLKKEITDVCLRTKYFNQELTDFWPKESRKTILEEAKKLCVWVEQSPNPKTNKSGYIIKGEKQKVEKMLHVIEEEFREFSSHLPKHRIKSDKAPRRGTIEFLKYAADSDEQFPSYWKLNSSKNYLKSMWSKLTSKISESESTNLVDVDAKTKDAIKKLIHNTWNPNLVGQGNDAAGLTHRGIKIIDVKRIENLQLFEPYSMQRKMLFKRICETGRICPDIGKIVHSKRRVETTEKLEGFMKEELYYEINEHYLFHGTRFPKYIIANGIDSRVSSDGALFGKGIYTAEMFTKSDQYTDLRNDRSPPGKPLTMILARVLLGNVFLCNEQHKSVANKQSVKLTRPPCMNCREDKCNCENQKLFDSVLGDGKWIFREFVVYDKSHCYPEYVIYYQRI